MRTAVACTAIFASCGSAWAGPPFVTDDPEPVEHRHWEVNYALSKSWRLDESSSATPIIDINYGVVPDVQLHAQPRYSRETVGEETNRGIDDTEVGVKYRFLNVERDGSSFMAGIYPMYQVPTGNTSLGPGRGKKQLFLPVWLQWGNSKWIVYGGTGYRLNRGADTRNSMFTGATALYKLTPSLQLGGELFHEPSGSIDAPTVTGFNLGGSFRLMEDYSLLFSAGRGLANISLTNQLSVYMALQVLY